MPSVVSVIGGQWGDEGKGKIVDVISEKARYCVRFQGGSNAGHTIIFGGNTYKLRLLPSGTLRGAVGILGAGMAINLNVLKDELKILEDLRGIEEASASILIDHRAHLVLPTHIHVDTAREEKSSNRIGTTRNGIGICYEDKARRIGIRAGDLLNPSIWEEKAQLVAEAHYQELGYSCENLKNIILDNLDLWREDWESFICEETTYVLQRAFENDDVVIEGAQGTFLDISNGTYPYVTSSNTLASSIGASIGCALPNWVEHIGVFKAYCTRVGSGPFPTEDFSEMGNFLQKKGKEFGVVTGRTRRCGWLNLDEMKYAVAVNGFTQIALTKVDVLDGLKKVKVFYNNEYYALDGWDNSKEAKTYNELHPNLKNYISLIESFSSVRVTLISNGPDRLNLIYKV